MKGKEKKGRGGEGSLAGEHENYMGCLDTRY